MEREKWTDKIKNAVVLERVGDGKNIAGSDKEEKKKLTGLLGKKGLPAEGYSRRNSKTGRFAEEEYIR